jgi:hypothetical protein
LLYIEDNSDLPDSFCKEVILTNNDNNGVVNLQILKKENYGYSVRRNVLITEAIELITKNGIWIPKIIADQFEYVNDLDVIIRPSKWSFRSKGEYRTDDIEFFDNWPGFDIDDLIDNHTFEYKDFLFVNPNQVLKYKRNLKRDKDKNIWGDKFDNN